jgi:hypothetical protein
MENEKDKQKIQDEKHLKELKEERSQLLNNIKAKRKVLKQDLTDNENEEKQSEIKKLENKYYSLSSKISYIKNRDCVLKLKKLSNEKQDQKPEALARKKEYAKEYQRKMREFYKEKLI